jgi:hypothetical protein
MNDMNGNKFTFILTEKIRSNATLSCCLNSLIKKAKPVEKTQNFSNNFESRPNGGKVK